MTIFARLSRFIVYIINPISGKGRAAGLQRIIEKKTSDAGVRFDIFPSRVNGDYSFLQTYIAEKKVTDIVIAGGDGTINQVVGNLLGHDINFGIIPCGSGNGLAYAARIPHQPEKAIDLALRGNATLVDGFMVNEKFACMLCGLGFDAKVAHDFANQKHRGLYTYIKQVLRNYFIARAVPFEIFIGDSSFKTNAYFISVANSNQFGNHFTIAPKACIDDGLLDIVIVTAQNKLRVLWQTYRQVRGINKLQQTAVIEKKKSIIYFQSARVRVVNPMLAPLHIDGDPAETGNIFNFQVIEKCFRLIRP